MILMSAGLNPSFVMLAVIIGTVCSTPVSMSTCPSGVVSRYDDRPRVPTKYRLSAILNGSNGCVQDESV